ncbi:hypothetical protein FALBO_2356 [Fusarium albosuccineum]|uniref:Amino acid transporter transmembrane domain-containing protein n=1 Tax=Fusarium albosuccineum TaxID=1237068 RepID=A0A8H4LJJ4_9HYPO|nr:hypothetical protein FALBO_2356 [Fusarium albosuccineum]
MEHPKQDIYPSSQGQNSTKTSSHEKMGQVDHMDTATVTANGFGGDGGKNYRTMGRWDTVLVLLTNQIGLGFLSLPGVLRDLGLIPGIIAVAGVGCLTWYTAYELGQFYHRYPHVVNVVEMAKVVGGRRFELVAGIGLLIQIIMTSAATCVTISIAFNTISTHALCTVGFIGISCLGCWVLCVPRTARFVSQTGIPCCIGAVAAALIVIISLGVADPANAPSGWDKEIVLVAYPDFRKRLNAALKITYTYSANINFVSFMAEMVDPKRDYNFALAWLEVCSIAFFTLVAVVIYCLAGDYTTSPAFGSAPQVPAQIAYGIILPTIFSTGLAFGHTAGKYIYVEVMKAINAAHQMTDNSFKSWSIWMGTVTSFWALCFVISNAIPVFDSILAIASATTISWFTFGFSAIFWLFLNWDVKFSNWKKASLTCVNVFLIIMSLFLNAAGLWSSITELIDIFADETSQIRGAFSCGDNALF